MYTLTWTGFEPITLVVIETDCTGSCKFNYDRIMTTMVPVKCLDTFYYTYLPNEKYDRNATLFCPDCSAVWANLATMPTFPAELASSNSPPKSWAWCKHSWAKPNSHLLMASSANCFHFCSLYKLIINWLVNVWRPSFIWW